MKIWLAYVNYPITTAVYLRRALLQMGHQVTTIGPRLPEEAITLWGLQNLKEPLTDQDIATDFTPDMADIWARTAPQERPDLYLWVESVNGYWPTNLDRLPCPKAAWLIDSHVALARHIGQAPSFDFVFLAQRAYLDDLRLINPSTHWLPLGCDPQIHAPTETSTRYDLSFVGSLLPDTRRHRLLERLSHAINIHCERCFLDEMSAVFSASRMVFNNAVQQDLNMRFFEVLATGSLLLSDLAEGSGQAELFVAGSEYACYHDANIVDVALHYLHDEPLRRKVAARGQDLVRRAHTYAHRMEDLLTVVLRGKPDTWSAAELRSRSLPPEEPAVSAEPAGSPISIGIPRSVVPLQLRTIVTARATRPHPLIQTAVEWGNEFATHFGLSRHDLDVPHYTQNQAYLDNEVDFIFLSLADDLRMFRYNKRLIPFLNDVWPQDLEEFRQTLNGYRLVYVASLDICKQLNRLGHDQVRWLPFSVATCHLRPTPAAKTVDIIQFGRRNPVFDSYMEKLLSRFPWIHYVTTVADHDGATYRFSSNLHGDLGPSNDRNHFMEILRSSRISLVSPPGLDGENTTGGCQVAGIRYFESIAGYCHLVSRHQASTEFKILGLHDLCHRVEHYEEFEPLILKLLQQPFDETLTRRYREVQDMHTTEKRALQVRNDLLALAAG